jgi:hypothetical protein
LWSVFHHRYLTARHVQRLHFAGSSARAAQRRLRQLWEHGYLDRAFIPTVILGDDSAVPHTGGPLYCLAAIGARRLSELSGRPFRDFPSTPAQNRVSFETLCHNLIVTDWLTSLVTATREVLQPSEVVFERDMRALARCDRKLVVPDGAVRFGPPASAWSYLEVVRADPRGGRKTLLAKFHRYVELQHRRAFRTGFEHHPVRRVLFVTPTDVRRDNLVVLATSLRHGAQLFAFASYGATRSMSAPSAFTPESIDDPIWRSPGSDTLVRLSELIGSAYEA